MKCSGPLPLCGRDQTRHWYDKLGLAGNTATHVLLFQYELNVRQSDQAVDASVLACYFGMFEGYRGHAGTISRIFQNSRDNSIPVTPTLLVTMVEHIEELRRRVDTEQRVAKVMQLLHEHQQQWV